jgi:predicted Zn-dependent protease
MLAKNSKVRPSVPLVILLLLLAQHLVPMRASILQLQSGRRPDAMDLAAKAAAAYHSGQLDSARRLLEEALHLDPRLAPARALLGLVLARQNSIEGALHNLREAHEIEPDNPDYAYDYAVLLLQDRRFAAAVPILESLHRRTPHADDVLVNLARAYSGAHESQKLSAISSNLPSADYNNDSLLKTLATILAASGDKEAVERLWNTAIDHYPLPYAALTELWIASGQPRRAQALLTSAPAVARGPLYVYAQGETQMALGRYNDAVSSFAQLTRHLPDNKVAWRQLVRAYMLSGQLTVGDLAAQQAARKFPADMVFRYQRAVINYMLGRTATAIKALSPVLQAGNANNPRALLLMAVLKSQRGDYPAATRYFQQEQTLDTGCNALGSYFYGVTLLRMHRLQVAQQQLQNATQCRPHFALAEYRLGQALLQAGDLHQALGSLRQATDDDPALAEPYYALAQVRRRLGDPAGAQADLQRFNALHKHVAHSDRNLFRPSGFGN